LKKCNRCGAESNDEAQFCYKCGSSMTVGAYQPQNQPPRLFVPAPVQTQKKRETDSVLAIILVVVLAVALIIGAVIFGNAVSRMPWDNWDHDIDMTVTGQSDYASSSDPPVDGYRYVVLTVTVENNGDTDLTLKTDQFLLYTSDDQYYAWASAVPESVPSSIGNGDEATFMIGFMIPEDSIPSVLELNLPDYMFGTVRTAVPS